MRITFPYPDIPALDVPDENLLGYVHPKQVESPPPEEALIREALGNPVSAPRLRDAVRPEHAVLLVVDDLTRPTPVARLLPPILDELHQGGVDDARIAFLLAYGSHRDMTDEEKRERLGSEISDRYVILDHHYDDEDQLRDRGRIEEMPVLVNRHVVEADFVIGVGHIVPHRSHGYGGGGKIILPGVAGKDCVDRMHWRAAQIPTRDLLGRIENPIRHMTDEFALRAGLSYIVDVVQDDEERLVGVWAGDPVKAHRKGCEQAREIYCVSIPEPADICVIDSYPADIDLWQANKALFASEPAVKQDGVVILVTPSPEGASKPHPHLAEIGFQPPEQLEESIRAGKLEKGADAAALLDGGRIIKEKATGILVSTGIDEEEGRKLGFLPAATPQVALEQAFEMKGSDAAVLVVHHGGEIVLRPDGTE